MMCSYGVSTGSKPSRFLNTHYRKRFAVAMATVHQLPCEWTVAESGLIENVKNICCEQTGDTDARWEHFETSGALWVWRLNFSNQ